MSIPSDECDSSVDQGFPDLLEYLSCTDEVHQEYNLRQSTLIETTNGTFCKSSNQEVSLDSVSFGHVLHCNIIEYPGMNLCAKTSGSHDVTFWSYLALRTATDWTRKSSYALLDGASLRYVIEDTLRLSKLRSIIY